MHNLSEAVQKVVGHGWSVYNLVAFGSRIEQALEACPITALALGEGPAYDDGRLLSDGSRHPHQATRGVGGDGVLPPGDELVCHSRKIGRVSR